MSVEYARPVSEHLMHSRIVYLSGDITTASADYVVSRLLVLDSIDSTEEIKLYISSFGGSVYAGLAIYDAMQLVDAPVSTLCIGPAFSMAAWLLAAGEPGRRFATPSSRIMIHAPSAGLVGTTSDLRIAAQNLLENERTMIDILARHTGRDAESIARSIERDVWMSPERAVELGILDGVTAPARRKQGLARPATAGAAPESSGVVPRAALE